MIKQTSRNDIIRREQQGSKIVSWDYCQRIMCGACLKRQACDNEEFKIAATQTLKELQEIVPGGYHMPFPGCTAPQIVVERVNAAKRYMEIVDSHIDLLKEIQKHGEHRWTL